MNKVELTEALLNRTKVFALRVIKLFQSLPKSVESQVIGKQILKCGTSVAANYRAACRARSGAESTVRKNYKKKQTNQSIINQSIINQSITTI